MADNPLRRLPDDDNLPPDDHTEHHASTPDTQNEPSQAKKPRKKRGDSGTERITIRDRQAFTWIGEMMVVRLDHLQTLLWRLSHRHDLQKYTSALARSSAREVVEKWAQRGLAEWYKFFDDEDVYVWLTREGQKVAGLPYRKAFNQKRGLLAHYSAVNRIRLYVEGRYGTELTWVSERHLRYEQGSERGHIPDGVIIYQGQRAAIEAELSTKSKRTSLEDMRLLAERYDNVWFFPDATQRRRVERTIKKLPPEEQESFMVYTIEEQSA